MIIFIRAVKDKSFDLGAFDFDSDLGNLGFWGNAEVEQQVFGAAAVDDEGEEGIGSGRCRRQAGRAEAAEGSSSR